MRNFFILLGVIIFEVAGNISLSHGMRQVGPIHWVNVLSFSLVAARLLVNPWIGVGVLFLAFYFFCYLTALAGLDLSYVVPMSASSFLLTVFLSFCLLGEKVSTARWIGTGLISIGVLLVGWSKRRHTRDFAS